MTPEQEKAARAYRRRQSWGNWLRDLAVNAERQPRMLLGFSVLLFVLLLVELWPQ